VLPLALLLAGASVASAQQMRQILFKRVDRAVKNDVSSLASVAKVPLEFDFAHFRQVAGPTLAIGAVPLAGGTTVDLDLKEFSVLAPDATITVTGDNGETPFRPSVRLYRGTVSGDPSSTAYLAICSSGVTGAVTTHGRDYEIATDLKATRRQNVVPAYAYAAADVPSLRIGCGFDEKDMGLIGEGWLMKDQLLREARKEHSGLQSGGDSILYSVKGAFDADYEFYQLFGRDTTAAFDYMISTIGRMSDVYERDLKTQIVIGYMHVWATASDPYTQFPVMQNALYEERDYWKADKPHQQIDRGFVHTFSAKAWTNVIGIAFLNVLCLNDASYSFSLQTHDNPRQDVFVLCHEVGHNFGSKHTHDCSWNPEIDRCAPAEGGNCFGPAQVTQSLGTIMSYCAQTEMQFHQKCIDTIRKYLAIPSVCVEVSRKLSVRNSQIDFSTVVIGTPVDTTLKDFFYNNSRFPVTVSEFKIAGDYMDRLTVVTKDELPFTLQPGQSHDLHLKYLSSDENSTIGSITVIHDGQNLAIPLAVQAYSYDNSPLLGFGGDTKSEVHWGRAKVGMQADTVVTGLYQNHGKSPLNVKKTEIVGKDRFEFQIIHGTAPFTLATLGGKLAATLRFAPLTPGTKEAWLRVESDSRGGADSIHLIGDADQGPLLRLKVSNMTVNFGKCTISTTYDTLFTDFFFNAGSDTLEVQPTVIGPNGDAFTVNLGLMSLAPGTGLNLPITFFDTSNGYKTAYMLIYTNTPRKWDTVFLVAQIGDVTTDVPREAVSMAGMTIAPNPTGGDAEITMTPLEGEIGRSFTIVLVDPVGREVSRQEGVFARGETKRHLGLEMLPSGRYSVLVTTARGTTTRSVTVVH
jgi:hypothetical protein